MSNLSFPADPSLGINSHIAGMPSGGTGPRISPWALALAIGLMIIVAEEAPQRYWVIVPGAVLLYALLNHPDVTTDLNTLINKQVA